MGFLTKVTLWLCTLIPAVYLALIFVVYFSTPGLSEPELLGEWFKADEPFRASKLNKLVGRVIQLEDDVSWMRVKVRLLEDQMTELRENKGKFRKKPKKTEFTGDE